MSDFYSNGTRWGRIDNDGRIYSSDGTYLGRIYNDGKFYDSSYTYMGSIDKNGKIRNYRGDYLGSIQSNGELLNDLGEYIGMFPYYNGRIGKFSTNHTSSTNNDTSTKKNETSSTTPQTTSNSGGSSISTPVLLPEDDLGFYIVLILGIILVFGGYLKIKEVIHTPLYNYSYTAFYNIHSTISISRRRRKFYLGQNKAFIYYQFYTLRIMDCYSQLYHI